jgi:tetratricopeptide (TPR) repeat protein
MDGKPPKSSRRKRRRVLLLLLLLLTGLLWTRFLLDRHPSPGIILSATVSGLCLAGLLTAMTSSRPAPQPAPANTTPNGPREKLAAALVQTPRDPVLMIQLARAEKKAGNRRKGEKYYRKAIHELWAAGERALAAAVYEEFFLQYGKVFCGPIQFQLARELSRQGKYEMAALSLEAFIRDVEVRPELIKEPELVPRAFAALGRIYERRLRRPVEARRVFSELMLKYPLAGWKEATAG